MTKTEFILVLVICYMMGAVIMQHFIVVDINEKRLEESEMCRVVAEECSNLLKCN